MRGKVLGACALLTTMAAPAGAALRFDRPTEIAVGNNPTVMPLPVDADGLTDLIVPDNNEVQAAVLRNRGDFAFDLFGADLGGQVSAIGSGDLDGTNQYDLAVVTGEGNVVALKNLTLGSAPTFAAPYSVDNSGTALTLTVAELDNNANRRDLLVGDSRNGGELIPYRNNESGGTLAFLQDAPLVLGHPPVRVLVTSPDGVNQYAAAAADDGNVYVARRTSTTGAVTFTPTPTSVPGTDDPVAFTAADLDGDGKEDLVVGGESSASDLVVLRSTSTSGSPSYSRQVLAASYQAGAVTTRDLTGDNKPELIVGDAVAPGLRVYINTSTPGTISFAAPIAIATEADPSSLSTVLLSVADPVPQIVYSADADTGVVGIVRVGADPAPAPGSLSFGTVAQGVTSAPHAVTITNTGEGAMHVRRFAASSDFLVGDSTCLDATVDPGHSCTVDVRFAPSAAGARNGSLRILDAGGETASVGLSGTGGALPQGPKGDPGPRGPAGRDAKVTCKVAKRKHKRVRVTCTVRLAHKATVRLLRHGHVVRRGRGRRVLLRNLRPGRYVLVVGTRRIPLRVSAR